MEYLFLSLALFAAIRAYSYGSWLKQSGNLAGAIGAWFFAALTVALPLIRIYFAP